MWRSCCFDCWLVAVAVVVELVLNPHGYSLRGEERKTPCLEDLTEEYGFGVTARKNSI